MKAGLWILTFFSAVAGAQDLSFMSPGSVDRTSISLEHSQMAAPDSSPGLSVEEQKAAFTIPVYNGLESRFSFIARGQRTELGERLRFSQSGVEIPEQFGTADFGFFWNKEDLIGNKTGISATYGNAGTRLFSGQSNPVVSANLIFERKKLDHSWFYFLSYSNNRTTLNNIPVPGIAYGLNGKTYNLIFGLPFAFVMWRPDPFSIVSSFSPFGVSIDLGFRVWGPLQLFGLANWSPRSYQNLVEGSDNRLIFDKKEAGGGLRLNLGPKGSFSVGYFHNFDRRFLLSETITDRDAEKIEISDSSGLQVKARLAF